MNITVSCRPSWGDCVRRTLLAAGCFGFSASAGLLAADAPARINLSEAVMRTVGGNPGAKSDAEVQRQREGILQTATGAFDWVAFSQISREVDRQPGVSNLVEVTQRTDTETYSAGIAHLFRSGISVQPRVTVFGRKENLRPSLLPDSETEYRSDLGVDITIPLLRNFGRGANAADETAARINVTAGTYLYEHAIAQRIARTASSYWNCLAALRNYEIVSDTERRATELVRFVELLVEGGELGVGSRDKARAELLKRRSQRSDAELALYQARQSLAVAIGYAPDQLANAPMADGEFPVAPASLDFSPRASDYIRTALARRGDYRAALSSVEVEQVQLIRARNQLKPRVDFTLSAGYAGLEDGTKNQRAISSLSNRLAGPNALGIVSLEWPIANNAARGEVVRRRARVAASEYDSQTAANSVASSVLATLEAVRLNLAQYHASSESAKIYARTLKTEQDNVSSGESSLLDLIDLEERYSTARANEIDALRAYAVSLVDLRLVTGTLIDDAGPNAVFNASRLLEPPQPAAP